MLAYDPRDYKCTSCFDTLSEHDLCEQPAEPAPALASVPAAPVGAGQASPDWHKQNVHQRIAGMAGTLAEGKFEAWMASRGYHLNEKLLRKGHDQVSTRYGIVATLEPWEQKGPDYVQLGGHYWEVMGGRDHIKVKRDKLEVLWREYQLRLSERREVRFYFYFSETDEGIVCDFPCVLWALHDPRARYEERLVDAKDGWVVPVEVFRDRLVVDAFDLPVKFRQPKDPHSGIVPDDEVEADNG